MTAKMEKRNFVKLCNLLDIAYEGETTEQRAGWVRSVTDSVGEYGYTIDCNNCEYTMKQFSTDEIEFVDIDCYNFMGSADEPERFFAAKWLTVVEKATGDYYAYETDDVF